LRDLAFSGPRDLELAKAFSNPTVVQISAATFHSLLEDQARARPDAPAIFAWDGQLTYGELDEAANRLAQWLAHLGVGVEDRVLVCFEKSARMYVAVIAVNKAGAA
jgi:non-ribosomal peptide synthetase component F